MEKKKPEDSDKKFSLCGCSEETSESPDSDEAPGKVSMWEIIPEIPENNAGAFEYHYDSGLEGMVITNYLLQSPKVRIPEKLEDKPVVGVELGKCKKELAELVMPNTVKTYSLSDNILKNIEYINIPGVTEIGDRAFYRCQKLKGVYIGSGVTKIGEKLNCENTYAGYGVTVKDGGRKVTITYGGCGAFSGCLSLKSINIPESVTEIGMYAFNNCRSLTTVTIPEGVRIISNSVFQDCTGLTSINIPEGVTEIGGSAFQNCTGLTAVTIPDSVTSIGDNAFYDCTNLKSVKIGSGVSKIGNSAFQYCTSLTSINVPEGVTEIGFAVFDSCISLAAITIPDSVKIIGDNAFDDCACLTGINIPDGVGKIGGAAFRSCTSLKDITIPESVTEIDISAFYN